MPGSAAVPPDLPGGICMHLGEERVESGRISQGAVSRLYLLAEFLSFFFFGLLCFYGADPVCPRVTLPVSRLSQF